MILKPILSWLQIIILVTEAILISIWRFYKDNSIVFIFFPFNDRSTLYFAYYVLPNLIRKEKEKSSITNHFQHCPELKLAFLKKYIYLSNLNPQISLFEILIVSCYSLELELSHVCCIDRHNGGLNGDFSYNQSSEISIALLYDHLLSRVFS